MNGRFRSNSVSSLNNSNNNLPTQQYDHNFDIIKNEFFKLSNNVLSIYDSLNNYCDNLKQIYLNSSSFYNNSFSYFDSDHPISKYSNELLQQINKIFNEWAMSQSKNFQILVDFCSQLDSIRIKFETFESNGASIDSNLKSEIIKDVKYQFESRVNGFDIPLINIQFSIITLVQSINSVQNSSSSNLHNKINFLNPVSNIQTPSSPQSIQTNSLITKSPSFNNSSNINNGGGIITSPNNNNFSNKPPLPNASTIKKSALKPLARPASVEVPTVIPPKDMYVKEEKPPPIGQHITPPPRVVVDKPQQHVSPPPRLEILRQHTKPPPSISIQQQQQPQQQTIQPPQPLSRPRAQSVNYSSPPLQQLPQSQQKPQPLSRPTITPAQTPQSPQRSVQPTQQQSPHFSKPAPLFPKPSPQPIQQSSPPPQPIQQSSPPPQRPLPIYHKPQPISQPVQQEQPTIQQPLAARPSFSRPRATSVSQPLSQPVQPIQQPPIPSYKPPTLYKPQPAQSQPTPSYQPPTLYKPQPTQQPQQISLSQQPQAQKTQQNFTPNHFNYNYPPPKPPPKYQPYPSLPNEKAQTDNSISSSSSASSYSSKGSKGLFSSFAKALEVSVNNINSNGAGAMSGYRCGFTGRVCDKDPEITQLMYDYDHIKQIWGNGRKFKLLYCYTQTIKYYFDNSYTIVSGTPTDSIILYIYDVISFQSQQITDTNIVFSDSNGNVIEPTKYEHIQNVLIAEFPNPKKGETFRVDYEFTADLYSCTLVEVTSPNEYIQVEPITEFEIDYFTQANETLNFDTPEFEQYMNDTLLYRQQFPDGSYEESLCFAYRISLYIKHHVKYDYSCGGQTPLETLNKGRGNCSSYSNLFASIMRYNKIPCKIISGTVHRKAEIPGGLPPAHAQNEFYIDGIGWVPYNGAVLENPDDGPNFNTYNFFAFGRCFGDMIAFNQIDKLKGLLRYDDKNLRDYSILNCSPPRGRDLIKLSDFPKKDPIIEKIDPHEYRIA